MDSNANNQNKQKFFPDIESWTNYEIKAAWDRREKLKLTNYVDRQMEEIQNEWIKRQGRGEM